MSPTKQVDLEKLLEEEQKMFKENAMSGEFGELSTFYTPFERRVVHAAEFIDAHIPYASVVLQYVRNIISGIGAGIVSLVKNRDKWLVVDDDLDEEEPTEVDIEQESTNSAKPAKLLYFPGIKKVQLPALHNYLSHYAQQWASQRVAENLVQRLYDVLIASEASLSENAGSIEKNRIEHSHRKDTLWEEAVTLRMELLQKETLAKELTCKRASLADDCETAKSMVDTYLQLLYTPNGDEIAPMRRELDRQMRNVTTSRAEKYITEREYRALSHSITYLSDQIEEREAEISTKDRGIQQLEESYILVEQNRRNVMRWRSLIEQHNMRYEAWKEAISYARNIPAPIDIKTIVENMERRIEGIRKAYKQKYELEVSAHVSG